MPWIKFSEIGQKQTNSLEQAAYTLMSGLQPNVLKSIRKLLDMEQTPTQIADTVAMEDVALAGLVELAASYMSKAAPSSPPKEKATY
jgi:hypothetical protein